MSRTGGAVRRAPAAFDISSELRNVPSSIGILRMPYLSSFGYSVTGDEATTMGCLEFLDDQY